MASLENLNLQDLDPKILWLFIFVGLYWAYCLFWGIKGALSSKTATDYMIAGRGLGLWVFVLAATATSFSGWTFVGHPGTIYTDGFQYAYASFYAITIPFTGVLFLKRQWMLGKRFGFVTPGEMLYAYFKSDTARLLTVLVALVFSIPYLGIQLRASGFLFEVLTDGQLGIWVSELTGGWLSGVDAGMWLLSIVVAIYVASGGLRAVAYVDTLQCILLAAGIVAIGLIAFYYIPDLPQGLAALAHVTDGSADFGKTTPDGYSSYVAIPGVIQMVSNGPSAQGGAWSGIMVLTYMFALMGIQSAPAFSMWAFANKSPAPFAPQQVWASSFFIGLILFVFTAIQGLGSHFLGADLKFMAAHPDLVNNVLGEGLGGKDLLDSIGKGGMLVPQLIHLMGDIAPWLVGLLSVCALAAMQSTGAAYMSTAGSMITRDILRRFIMPNASDAAQKFWGRLCVLAIVAAALYVATVSNQALVLLGGLAVAYGFQMWPALIAVCWWPFLTRPGIVLGLIAGLIAVTMTDSTGAEIWPWLEMEPLWGKWPLTIHSAGWGIICNLGVAIIISAITQTRAGREHRMKFHTFLRQHASLPNEKKGLVPLAWILTLSWFFFAIGPGAVIGNTVFGDPNDPSTWLFGIPSIWSWQILFWVLGCFMMWLLAYKMEMSTVPSTEVEALVEEGHGHGAYVMSR
ncbi:MAG: sodium:solute symporter family protein [Candidatus Competibacteraceae bacterium]|nr:sodium:solute symporter family protein [Candidatus Competibacteraceae bacterium]MCB1810428.1 sodium:solute symporter family protein [Candidatus Competibacteraceae bacterium]